MAKINLKPLIKRLRKIKDSKLIIVSSGKYPDKRGTLTGDVAFYQNDGTDRIKASHFFERTIKAKKGWKRQTKAATDSYLKTGSMRPFRDLGSVIANDISDGVDRIKTGRMKNSFKYRLRLK